MVCETNCEFNLIVLYVCLCARTDFCVCVSECGSGYQHACECVHSTATVSTFAYFICSSFQGRKRTDTVAPNSLQMS